VVGLCARSYFRSLGLGLALWLTTARSALDSQHCCVVFERPERPPAPETPAYLMRIRGTLAHRPCILTEPPPSILSTRPLLVAAMTRCPLPLQGNYKRELRSYPPGIFFPSHLPLMTIMEEMLPGTPHLLHDRHRHINGLTLTCTAAQLPNIFLRSITSPISQQDLDELQAMRIAAGLYYDRIPRWIQEMQQGTRQIFFVYLSNPLPYAIGQQHLLVSQQPSAAPTIAYPVSASNFSQNSAPVPTTHPPQIAQLPSTLQQAPPAAVGMVCLLLYNAEDPSLASFSNSGRVEITSLFVFSAYRALGVALATLRAMEQRVAQMGALYVTLTTPAIDRSIQRYLNMGYREYKARAVVYSQAEVQSAGLGLEYTTGAFLEKRVS